MKRTIVLALLLTLSAGPAFAAKLIPNGSSSQSITVVIRDAAGAPVTGITIANLDLYCVKDGDQISAKTDLVALDSDHAAWSSGKAFEIGYGLYRIDIPDANLSNGVGTMLTYVIDDAVGANVTSFYEVQLSDPVSALLYGTAIAGSLTTITLTGGVATAGWYNGCLVELIGGTGAGQARTILSYANTTVATVTRDWIVAPNATTVFRVVAADVPAMLEAGTATAGASSSITLDADANSVDDVYNDNCIFISAGRGAGQSRQISDYTGLTKVANVTPAWYVNPNSTSVYQIVSQGRVDVGRWMGTVPLSLSSQRVQTDAYTVATDATYGLSALHTDINAISGGTNIWETLWTGEFPANSMGELMQSLGGGVIDPE